MEGSASESEKLFSLSSTGIHFFPIFDFNFFSNGINFFPVFDFSFGFDFDYFTGFSVV